MISREYSSPLLLYFASLVLFVVAPHPAVEAAAPSKAESGTAATNVSSEVQRVSAVDDAAGVDVILDTRPLSSCMQSSLKDARCVPVEDVLAPNRRMANWSGILWLLGTAGLSGHEHVLVIDQQHQRRNFMAGLLLLAGQHRITIVDSPLSELLADGSTASLSAGARRTTTRTNVYTAPMRSRLIVLQNEITDMIVEPTTEQTIVLLDGRTESEYYGVTIRGVRGGHLPGAVHSPMTQWLQQPDSESASTAMVSSLKAAQPIAYAHDAMESLGYLALLHAAGVHAKAYLPGWAEWSANTALPADSVSYLDTGTRKHHTRESAPVTIAPESAHSASSLTFTRTGAAIASVVIASLVLAGFFAGRKFSAAGA